MNRITEYSKEVKELSKKIVRDNMPEPYSIMIERINKHSVCNMVSERLTSVSQNQEDVYLLENNFSKTKKKDSSDMIIISKWDESKCDWVYLRHYYVITSQININQ